MPVMDSRARSFGDIRRHLVLVKSEGSTQEEAFADAVIERFFAALRHIYGEAAERASG
jgi:hypothetical protein